MRGSHEEDAQKNRNIYVFFHDNSNVLLVDFLQFERGEFMIVGKSLN